MSLKMDQVEIASVLEEVALLLELRGENPFKVRAFTNAARTLQNLEDDFEVLLETGKLTTIKGIGKSIEESIVALAREGRWLFHQELRSEFPKTLFELFRVPGLGPKKIKVLYEKLGIKSLGELEYACTENRLIKLPGFGTKTQDNIRMGIEVVKRNQGQFLYVDAIEVAQEILKQMESWPDVKRCSLAGSLRRCKEVVKDIDLLCASDKPAKVMKIFVTMDGVEQVIAQGPTKTSLMHKEGMQIDLRVVSDTEYPFALHHFTGSKDHNTALRQRAKNLGFKMNEYGIFKGDKAKACRDEIEIFKALNLSYIPPELREDRGEIELAEKGAIPELIQNSDLRGLLHCHTTYSDGKHTVEDMVRAAAGLGLDYIGISDHSQTAFYANGLKEDDLKRQREEIDRVQMEHPKIRIFWGIESDILPTGKLDYADSVLKEFDFVIASVHAKFQMTEEEMTERCLKALENRYCTMIGHPTGRILLARDGFKIDLHRLIDRAADLGKFVELNANPHRLDMDWRVLGYAKEKNVKIAINPDAHSTEGLKDVYLGVNVARKAALTAKDILNVGTAQEMDKAFEQARG